MSMNKLYTRKQAHLLYNVVDTEGPAEYVVSKILQILRNLRIEQWVKKYNHQIWLVREFFFLPN